MLIYRQSNWIAEELACRTQIAILIPLFQGPLLPYSDPAHHSAAFWVYPYAVSPLWYEHTWVQFQCLGCSSIPILCVEIPAKPTSHRGFISYIRCLSVWRTCDACDHTHSCALNGFKQLHRNSLPASDRRNTSRIQVKYGTSHGILEWFINGTIHGILMMGYKYEKTWFAGRSPAS